MALAVVPAQPMAALALLTVPLALAPARTVAGDAQGLALLPALKDTGRLALVYAVLLGVGLAL